MINKSIKYIGVILLAYTLNACNEQRMEFFFRNDYTRLACRGRET